MNMATLEIFFKYFGEKRLGNPKRKYGNRKEKMHDNPKGRKGMATPVKKALKISRLRMVGVSV